jgi:predicted ester cyclase
MALTPNRLIGFSDTSQRNHRAVLVRSVSGNIVAEESAFTLANYAASLGFNFVGFETALIGVEFGTVGSASDTVTLETMFYDFDGGAVTGGIAWHYPAGDTGKLPALKQGVVAEIPVLGRNVWFRVHAKSGTLTNMQIIAWPGKRY